jgi:hypothetical protein
LFVIFSSREKKGNPSSLTMGLGNPSNNENCDPEGRPVLESLRLLDRQLAAKVDRKTGKLIRLRLAVAEVKRLALQREAEQRRRSGAGGGA